MKPPSSACGPYDTIRVPHVAQDDMVDYEAELAVVIGKTCRDVTKEQALKYVAGKKNLRSDKFPSSHIFSLYTYLTLRIHHL
jgi:hypothetical protein